ncbi:hypothetical protein HDU91_005333, partial [Kappamyces sp. JEL0680]
MDAINALGTSAFSSSFVEKMMDGAYIPDAAVDTPNYPITYSQPHHQEGSVVHSPHGHYHPTLDASSWLPDAVNPYWAVPQLPPQGPESARKKSTNRRTKPPVNASSSQINITSGENNGNRRRTSQHNVYCTECHENVGIIFIR